MHEYFQLDLGREREKEWGGGVCKWCGRSIMLRFISGEHSSHMSFHFVYFLFGTAAGVRVVGAFSGTQQLLTHSAQCLNDFIVLVH